MSPLAHKPKNTLIPSPLRAAARELFGSDNPVGRRIHTDNFKQFKYAGFEDWEVIGVVADARFYSLRENSRPLLYLPFDQLPWPVPDRTLYIRSEISPAKLIPAVRREIDALDLHLPVLNMQTLTAQRDEALLNERVVSTLEGFFSFAALLLGCIGLYGVTAYIVSGRRHEIGIRVALGALPRQVLWLVLRQTGVTVAGGLLIGGAMAAASTRLFSALLYGVRPSAVSTFAAPLAAIISSRSR